MKIIFQMFARYTSQAKGRFCLMLLCTFTLTGLETGLALLMRDIISVAEVNGTLRFLLLSVLGFALLLGLDSLLSIGRYLSCDLFGEAFIGALRADLLRAVESADYEAILGIGRDKLKNILYYDTLNVFRTVGFQMETIFMNVILLIAFLAVAAYVNPLLSLILLTATVVGFLISFFSRKYIVRVSSGVNAQMKADNAVLNEFSDSLELVKTHYISDYFLQKQDKSFRDFIKASLRADAPIVGISSLETNYHQLVYLGIAAYLSMVLGGDGAGDLVFFLFATEKVISLSTSLESSLYAILRMAPSFVNAQMLLDMEQPDGDVTLDSIDSIEFRDVSFAYGDSRDYFIREQNAAFRKGDIVWVKGDNGSGKSTYMKLIVNLLRPKKGSILINGTDISRISKSSLHNSILYISQDEVLLNDSVKTYLESITGKALSEKQLNALLEEVRFETDITEIRDGGLSLSGGQRKKLMMIQLLLGWQSSSVIILDEFENALDADTRALAAEIENLICEHREDHILFRISHLDDMRQLANIHISLAKN